MKPSTVSSYSSKVILARNDLLFWGAFLVFVALQLWQHVSASYSFPTPWPDESSFLWQAVAFQENNTLFAPELHPDRSVFWMPPGFMIAMGLCFKVFGASLGVARYFSFVMLVLSFFAMALLIKHQRLPLLSLFIAAVIFLNAPFAACGNIARPEAMLLFLVFCGFLLLHHRQSWKGLSLLMLTPLVHPNGLYFVGSAALYLVVTRQFSANRKRISRADLLFIVIVILLWVLYLWHVFDNWSHFVGDMSFQIERKAERDLQSRLLNYRSILLWIVVGLALIYGRRVKIRLGLLIAIGGPCWFAYQIGFEMWYDIFWGLSLICFSVIILNVAYRLAIESALTRHPVINRAVFALAAIGVLYFNYWSDTTVNIHVYTGRMSWRDLNFPGEVPYLSDHELQTVPAFVDSVCFVNHLRSIQFLPRADVFMFPEIVSSGRILISHPHFCERKPDLYIIHLSRYLPSKWRRYLTEDLMRIFEIDDVEELNRSLSEWIRPFLLRDRTEVWLYIVPSEVPRGAVAPNSNE